MQNPRGKSDSNSTRRTAVSSLVIIGLMFVGLIVTAQGFQDKDRWGCP